MLAVVNSVVPAFSAYGFFSILFKETAEIYKIQHLIPSSSKLCLGLPSALKHIKVTKLNLSTEAAEVANLFII